MEKTRISSSLSKYLILIAIVASSCSTPRALVNSQDTESGESKMGNSKGQPLERSGENKEFDPLRSLVVPQPADGFDRVRRTRGGFQPIYNIYQDTVNLIR